MSDAPERIYFTTSKRAIGYIKWAGLDKKEPSDDLEYILNDIADKQKQEALGLIRDRVKRILFTMWERVESGQFDSRSFVGDTALSLRDSLYPPSEIEIEIFWKEYETWQGIKKDLGEK